MYYTGRGVPQNYTLAMEYFLKSSNKGHLKALNMIGIINFIQIILATKH